MWCSYIQVVKPWVFQLFIGEQISCGELTLVVSAPVLGTTWCHDGGMGHWSRLESISIPFARVDQHPSFTLFFLTAYTTFPYVMLTLEIISNKFLTGACKIALRRPWYVAHGYSLCDIGRVPWYVCIQYRYVCTSMYRYTTRSNAFFCCVCCPCKYLS